MISQALGKVWNGETGEMKCSRKGGGVIEGECVWL